MESNILELLASRICHDLISPIGAVHNGLEFLQEMGPDAGEEAIGLISHSAHQAAAKLQVFRLVYGAGGKDRNIKPEDIHAAFQKMIEKDEKVTQDWDPYSIDHHEKKPGFCKFLLGTMLLAQECLPKGGKVTVSEGDDETIVTAEGDGAGLRELVEEALNNSLSADDLDPRLVHPFTIGRMASEYGFSIKIKKGTYDGVVFTLS